MRKHTILGEPKIVFKGLWHKITQVPATLPNGEKKFFEFVYRVPTVVILAFDNKKRLLLTKEYKELGKKYIWHLPCGRADKPVSIKANAQAELREETGFRAKKIKLVYATPKHFTYPLYGFLASGLISDPLPGDPGEDIQVIPTDLNKAKNLALSGKIEDPFVAYLIACAWYLIKTKGWKAVYK